MWRRITKAATPRPPKTKEEEVASEEQHDGI